MRDDLLDAKAAVDWAVSNFPAFQNKFASWLKANISVALKEMDTHATHNVIVAIEKEPLPFAFSVEAGAYVNVIRSALDILAGALANRHGIPHPDRIYFPVARSLDEFRSRNYKGAELVKRLPDMERGIIESLKPYQGGNDALWALHQLDIVRKHHRLLAVNHAPARFGLIGSFRKEDLVFPRTATGYMAADDETVLVLLAKGTPKPNLQYTPEIFVAEIDPPIREPIIAALSKFASLANSIIELFDAP